jgi:hypothetical protein
MPCYAEQNMYVYASKQPPLFSPVLNRGNCVYRYRMYVYAACMYANANSVQVNVENRTTAVSIVQKCDAAAVCPVSKKPWLYPCRPVVYVFLAEHCSFSIIQNASSSAQRPMVGRSAATAQPYLNGLPGRPAWRSRSCPYSCSWAYCQACRTPGSPPSPVQSSCS